MKLGVNIDHTATLREARYRGLPDGEPDPIKAALACEAAGCYGITAHLREDRRHILDEDMDRLAAALKIPLNFEMANTPEMVSKALKLLPTSVCLVPEKRQEITTEGGLDVQSQQASIARTVQELQAAGIEVSLFVDPAPEVVRASIDTGARAIELHTGAFAEGFREAVSRKREIQRLVEAAELGHQGKLKVNAGHGLNYLNVKGMHEVPWLEELNIGHSIVAHALFVGFDVAVKEMLRLIHPVG